MSRKERKEAAREAKTVSPQMGASVEMIVRRGSVEEPMLATVVEETDKGLVLSSFERAEGVKLPEVNVPVKMRFHLRDSGYEFDSIILQKREAPVAIAYVAKPVAVTRRQLRAYLRVDCEIPVTLTRRDDPKRHPISGTITNLSGGGMLIALMVTINPNTQVEMKFDLGEDGLTISNVTGKIISIRAGEDSSRVHVVQLEAIDEEQRTAIIRHTFRIQQMMRRKKAGG